MKNKTFAPNKKEIEIKWHFFDAKDKTLGRLASEIVPIIMGKNKPQYSPNTNMGDKVVVINAKKISVTGKKLTDKKYIWHTGFPGGLKSEALRDLLKRKPTEVLRRAIDGMLPKNKLRKQRIKNLFIYEGEEHPHTAQITKKDA